MAATTIDDIRAAIAERKTTATALAADYYARIKKEDPRSAAFLTLLRGSRVSAGRTRRRTGCGW